MITRLELVALTAYCIIASGEIYSLVAHNRMVHEASFTSTNNAQSLQKQNNRLDKQILQNKENEAVRRMVENQTKFFKPSVGFGDSDAPDTFTPPTLSDGGACTLRYADKCRMFWHS